MGLLDGKVALIVGIANERSYAWHIAKALIDHGATCAYTCLPGEKSERRLRRALEALPGAGGENPLVVPMDAASDADIDSAILAFEARYQSLHVLVHSIAFADREYLAKDRFIDTPRDAFLSAVDISAYTLLGLTRRCRELLAKDGGSVMAMSYYGAEKVVPGYNVMGVAKATLEATARYLAGEMGQHSVRVNTISGGYLRTLASSAVGGADKISDQNLERSPLRRNVEGGDVGNTAVWLASDLSSGVTGENVYVDCGANIVGV
ncbi:MAG: enoyl-ACP reductase [Phycisphaerales bacterium]|nr:enoyl-ACP reductase [Phycisphaerales bacterium]